jgi:thiol-disulfide isomerase/thioredoxin
MRSTLLLAAVLLCAGCWQRNPMPELTTPKGYEDRDVKSLVLKKHPGGEAWRPSDYLGKVLLLDIWATWCDPCRESLPLYEDLKKQYAARGLEVWAISVDEDPNEIDPFIKQLKLELPIAIDPKAEKVEGKLKVKVMPTSFLIDKKGSVRFVHEGTAPEFLQMYLTEVEQLLAEP